MTGACRGYVLVVEDDLAIQNAVADLIREEHGVKTANDGRAALEIIRVSPPPSLILLDMMMPGMNGTEFLDEKNRIVLELDRLIASYPKGSERQRAASE